MNIKHWVSFSAVHRWDKVWLLKAARQPLRPTRSPSVFCVCLFHSISHLCGNCIVITHHLPVTSQSVSLCRHFVDINNLTQREPKYFTVDCWLTVSAVYQCVMSIPVSRPVSEVCNRQSSYLLKATQRTQEIWMPCWKSTCGSFSSSR